MVPYKVGSRYIIIITLLYLLGQMNNALATETMQSLGSNVHVIVDCGNNYMWWWRWWISTTAPTKPVRRTLRD